MGILAHLIATSASGKKLSFDELIALVNDLLNERIASLPAAILVGDARNTESYWAGGDEPYITPNSPGSMLDFDTKGFPEELIWYSGNDAAAFSIALHNIPFGEKDCCVCFPTHAFEIKDKGTYTTQWLGWDGAVIYALKQPFLLDLPDNNRSQGTMPILSHVTHYFALFSLSGGGYTTLDKTPLQTILEYYFGPDLLAEETIFW